MFINLFIAFFSLILIRPISITLNDGQIWEGNTGDIVEVEVEINNKFQKLQGEVTGGSDSYLMIEKEFFLKEDIRSIQGIANVKLIKEDPIEIVDNTNLTNTDEPESSLETDDTKELWLGEAYLLDSNGQKIDSERLFKEGSPINILLHSGMPKASNEKVHKKFLIPLKGQIGFTFGPDNLTDTDWFNEHQIEELLKVANRIPADEKTIYFLIDSNGGSKESLSSICNLIKEYEDNFNFISIIANAQNEASTIALSCDEIQLAPSSATKLDVIQKDSPLLNNSTLKNNYSNLTENIIAINSEYPIQKTSDIMNFEIENISIFDNSKLNADLNLNDWTLNGNNKAGKTQVTILREAEKLKKELIEIKSHTNDMNTLLCDIFDCDGKCDHMCRKIDSEDWPEENQKRITLKGTELRKAINSAQNGSAKILQWIKKGKYEFFISNEVVDFLTTIDTACRSILVERQILDDFPHCKKTIENLRISLGRKWSP